MQCVCFYYKPFSYFKIRYVMIFYFWLEDFMGICKQTLAKVGTVRYPVPYREFVWTIPKSIQMMVYNFQCCGSGSGIQDLVPFGPLDPR